MTNPEIFSQIERHLLEDPRPSQALERRLARVLPREFDPLQHLKTTEQLPVHHPERNIYAESATI